MLTEEQREAPAEEGEIWPGQVEAVEVWMACQTQWRVIAGLGGVYHQGIDRSAVHSAMQMLGVQDMRGVLAQVQLIEQGAREVLNR